MTTTTNKTFFHHVEGATLLLPRFTLCESPGKFPVDSPFLSSSSSSSSSNFMLSKIFLKFIVLGEGGGEGRRQSETTPKHIVEPQTRFPKLLPKSDDPDAHR